jgi:diguanylate cyclase (GGDEF)-like protein/PAS domain S-box-containing protein
MIRTLVSHRTRRVLHIGGNATDARTIREALAGSRSEPYEIEWFEYLADGLDRLAASRAHVALLDLQLPDCPGNDGLVKLLQAAPTVPVLVVGAAESEQIARDVIAAGAHDYLLSSRLDSYWLPRVLSAAIERKLTEEAFLADAERRAHRLSARGEALLTTDILGRVIHLNGAAEVLTGWRGADAVGRPLEEVFRIIDSATRERCADPRRLAIPYSQTPHIVSGSILIRLDGSESAVEHSATATYDRVGAVTGTAIVVRDVSAEHALSLRMAHLANHDPLTDLPNRLLLADRLARALALAHRHDRRLAVLFLDIDHFKYINDTLGHMLGDELLRAVAREATLCVRSSDTVSRHGGDEFVIVLSELEHAEDAALGAQKIVAALARPQQVAGHELHITVSVGISVYPEDGSDAEALLTKADMALYHAKDEGRDGYQFFTPDLNVRAVKRQTTEAGLHRALDKQEFELVYQPKINLKTGGVIGAEALIRWRHPDRGLVEPAEFVPIAEACGLIKPIGRWVVHEACRQAQAWQDAGLRPMPVAVNVSAAEFRNRDFLKNILDILRETRLDPHYLEIELTESVLMTQIENTGAVLQSLRSMGVQTALDDFGTGFSSLSTLRDLPIDALKVDKSFVHEITSRSSQAPIVSAVISMGKSLNHRVIAEGVETRDQLAFLRAEGCWEGQGYYFSRPLVPEQFVRVVQTA